MAVVLAGNLVFAPLSALLVLAWVHWSGTPWRDIGYVRPPSWAGDAAIGVVAGVALKLLMKAVVMPLLGAPPINAAYHYLAGNTAALPSFLLAVIVIAGWGEETLFRGFLFERLGRLFGNSTRARVAIVTLTSVLFGAAHWPEQGLAGVQQAAILGFVYGGIYAVWGRLFLVMCLHAAFDVAAVFIIYWDLEEEVAGFLFR